MKILYVQILLEMFCKISLEIENYLCEKSKFMVCGISSGKV